MHGARFVKWTVLTAAASLGAATIAGGATRGPAAVSAAPYDQAVGSATIDAVNGGKPFDIRGASVQRDASKITVTLVRAADAATSQLMFAVTTGKTMNVTLKLGAGSVSFTGLHAASDQVGAVGGALEQVTFVK